MALAYAVLSLEVLDIAVIWTRAIMRFTMYIYNSPYYYQAALFNQPVYDKSLFNSEEMLPLCEKFECWSVC